MHTPTPLMDVSKLSFDPDNPRLWYHTYTTNQLEIARHLVPNSDYHKRAAAIAAGLYQSHEPLLAYQDDKGDTIVVDGNARLFTLKMILDDNLPAQLGLTPPTRFNATSAHQIATVPVALYPTWDAIHPIRVYRQCINHCNWDMYTSALDYRRLAKKGVPIPTIGEMYHLEPCIILSRICALVTFEQTCSYLPEPPKPALHFRAWATAIEQHGIQVHLAISTDANYTNLEEPFRPERLKSAAELMSFLTGCLPNRASAHGKRVITNHAQITDLGRIYDNPTSLQKLRTWPTHTIEEIIDDLNGNQTHRHVRDTITSIHNLAVVELGKIKREYPDTIPHPTMIHVGATRHSFFNDRTSHYIVELSNKVPSAHAEVPAMLQERIHKQGYRCTVLFD